jgi:peptide/nickel transport system permease protein
VVTFKYALKNALIPIITVVGLCIGGALSGTVIIESVFDWPGLGLYVVDALLSVDLPAIMGSTILIGVIYVLVNLVMDISYLLVDPRIRY